MDNKRYYQTTQRGVGVVMAIQAVTKKDTKVKLKKHGWTKNNKKDETKKKHKRNKTVEPKKTPKERTKKDKEMKE